jgi:hypothetical protein
MLFWEHVRLCFCLKVALWRTDGEVFLWNIIPFQRHCMESERDLHIGLLVKRLGSSRPKFIIVKDMHNKIFDCEVCQVTSARMSRPLDPTEDFREVYLWITVTARMFMNIFGWFIHFAMMASKNNLTIRLQLLEKRVLKVYLQHTETNR